MARPKPDLPRVAALAPCALLALALSACDGNPGYPSPTAPDPPSPSFSAYYAGEGVVRVDTYFPTCGGSSGGVSTMSMDWLVEVSGPAINFIQNVGDPSDSAEYSGTLTGQSFVAGWSKTQGRPPACELREARLSGTFSEDFGAFDADLTLVYGPPESQTTYESRWSARRR